MLDVDLLGKCRKAGHEESARKPPVRQEGASRRRFWRKQWTIREIEEVAEERGQDRPEERPSGG